MKITPALDTHGYRLEGAGWGDFPPAPLWIEYDREHMADVNHRLMCPAGEVGRGAPVVVVIHAGPLLVQVHARAVEAIREQLASWGYRRVSVAVEGG